MIFTQHTDKWLTDQIRISQQSYYCEKERKRAFSLQPYITMLERKFKIKKVEVRVSRLRDKSFGGCFDTGRHIEIDSRQPFAKMLKTLIHEMTHAKQYQTRRLLHLGDTTYWEAKEYKTKKRGFAEYKSRPWEREAFSAENKLYKEIRYGKNAKGETK